MNFSVLWNNRTNEAQFFREIGVPFPTSDTTPVIENLEASRVYELILSIRNAVDELNSQQLWTDLNSLSALFQIRTDETIKSHNYRVFQMLSWLEKNPHDTSWEKTIQLTWELRNSQGDYIESKEVYKKPSPDIFRDIHYSHDGNIGRLQVAPCREREILLLKIYWIDFQRIYDILTSKIN